MAKVDLLFGRLSEGSLPANLTFGADGDAPTPNATVTIAGALPGVRGPLRIAVARHLTIHACLPRLRGSVALRYASDTQRPAVNEVRNGFESAMTARHGVQASWQNTEQQQSTNRVNYEAASVLFTTARPTWSDSVRIAAAGQARYQEALSFGRSTSGQRFSHAISLKLGSTNRYQEAQGLGEVLRRLKYQDANRTKRNLTAVRYQEAIPYWTNWMEQGGAAKPQWEGWQGPYQQAMRPPAGQWRPQPPKPHDPCYIPELPADLVFVNPWTGSSDLLFVCDRHDPPEPGATYVIPLLRIYMLVHRIDAILLPSGERVSLSNIRIQCSEDGFAWTLSAAGPARLVEQLAPENGVPRRIKVSIDGIDWVFAVKRPLRTRSFEGWQSQVSGQSVTSLLGAPYRRSTQWVSSDLMTAQQIALSALEYTGVALDWGVEDWIVPAGAWSHEGTPLTVVKRIAEAAGASVRSHRTEPTLFVLPEYKAMPWDWAAATPDVQMPGQIITQDTLTDLEQEFRNAVYVSGSAAGGVLGLVVRSGSAGELLAPQISDSLATDVMMVRQRGAVPLADSALRWRQEITVPLITGGNAPGLLLPGYLLEVQEPGESWRGLVRSLSIQENSPEVSQTITVDRYL